LHWRSADYLVDSAMRIRYHQTGPIQNLYTYTRYIYQVVNRKQCILN